MLDCLFVLFEFKQEMPAPERRLQTTRIELERVLEGQYRVRRTPRLDQREAKILPKLRIAGFELHRLVKHQQRFLAPALREQRGAEARQVKWLGIAADRLGKPLHGMVVLLGMERQKP